MDNQKVFKGIRISKITAEKLNKIAAIKMMSIGFVVEIALLQWFQNNPITPEEVAAFATTYKDVEELAR